MTTSYGSDPLRLGPFFSLRLPIARGKATLGSEAVSFAGPAPLGRLPTKPSRSPKSEWQRRLRSVRAQLPWSPRSPGPATSLDHTHTWHASPQATPWFVDRAQSARGPQLTSERAPATLIDSHGSQFSSPHHIRAGGAWHGRGDPRGRKERQGGLDDPSATGPISLITLAPFHAVG